LFKKINDSSHPTILFIDEVDTICRKRTDGESTKSRELTTTFLSLTGKSTNKYMIIAATNCKDQLDEAFLNRMDDKLEIGPPDLNGRKKILQKSIDRISDNSIKNLFTEEVLKEMAKKTEGLTGRTLEKLINSIDTSMQYGAKDKSERKFFEIVDTCVQQNSVPDVSLATAEVIEEDDQFEINDAPVVDQNFLSIVS
jgi:SpoVK/Ycf46/Vps4 family AAA+-type ATPase